MSQTSVSGGQVTTFDSPSVLADEVARWLMRLALQSGDRFTICLSGGSTPKALYERLAQAPFAENFPWAKTHLFFGDERFVPDGDKDNNFTMASRAMLARVAIPKRNVHRIVTGVASAEKAAADYESTLKTFYGSDRLEASKPLFDVNLLGLGPDGHTASLIPGQPVLEERQRWVAAVTQGRPEARITLTYPPLEASRHIAFLVVGQEKREMLAHVRSGATDVPAARLQTRAEVHWFTDRAAIEP